MTSKHTITGTDVVNAVRKLAAEFPDNVYGNPFADNPFSDDSDDSQCSNVDGICSNGTYGCLIGQALVACGIDRDELAKTCPVDIVEDTLLIMEIPFTADEVDWLLEVQNHQDAVKTWSRAVAIADGE